MNIAYELELLLRFNNFVRWMQSCQTSYCCLRSPIEIGLWIEQIVSAA